MPRSKVAPENRQRSVRACTSCKASKIRCNGQQPCATCERRRRVTSCVYQDALPRARIPTLSNSPAPPPQASPAGRHDDQTETIDVAIDDAPNSTVEHDDENESDTTSEHTLSSAAPDETWRTATHSTQSQTLLSSKGEKVYVGEMASLSFLQFLRQVIRKCLGPSPFTDGDLNNVMFENDFQSNAVNDSNIDNVEVKKELIQSYFEATSGILYLYTKAKVIDLLERSQHGQNSEGQILTIENRDNLIALYLCIAIGGQSRGRCSQDSNYARSYFDKAQKLAFTGMLCDPSIAMVRIFLLMAFYMLGACHRNAAFMYLGVASKAASALGLHMMSQYKSLPPAERKIRLRIWKSLSVLDSVVSLILGRSGGRPSPCLKVEDISQLESGDEDREDSTSSLDTTLNTSFEACSLIEDILQDFSSKSTPEIGATKKSLQDLKTWLQKLPASQKLFSCRPDPDLPGPDDRERLLGNLHVASIYYFAVILLTRPFLISHSISRLREDNLRTKVPPKPVSGQSPGDLLTETNPDQSSTSIQPSGRQPTVSQLAQVCVDSATFVAQICDETNKSGYLPGNMCLVKAWIFAAGLVLGFYTFVQSGGTSLEIAEAQQAFQSCRTVLQRFANLSPQAQHYYDILTRLSESTSQYHQKLLRDRRRITRNFVHEMIQFDFLTGDARGQTSGTGSGYAVYPSPNQTTPDMMNFTTSYPMNNTHVSNNPAADHLVNFDLGNDILYTSDFSDLTADVGTSVYLPSFLAQNPFDYESLSIPFEGWL